MENLITPERKDKNHIFGKIQSRGKNNKKSIS